MKSVELRVHRKVIYACEVEWVRLARIAWRAPTASLARRFIERESWSS